MKKKEGKNEEKILGVHLKATVSKGEKLVSNNGRLAMVSHHCLHLYITSISIHCKDRKKNTTIFFQTRSTYKWMIKPQACKISIDRSNEHMQ